jgi:hypothetical protein
VPCRLLHGNTTAEDGQRSIELFFSAGGVLAATPWAFDRFGRRTQLKVYALVPSTDTFGSAFATPAEKGG